MSGPAPLPKRIFMRIWFITIGIGFGIMETATLETKEFIRWILLVG